MRHEFVNEQPVPIAPERSTVESTIEVTDLGSARIKEVEVTLDVTPTRNSDLRISVCSPNGTEVTLLEGGFRDDLRSTVFRDNAQTPISSWKTPVRGIFSPQQHLATLNDEAAEGKWKLTIEDRANQDGGALNRWTLGLMTDKTNTSAFHVDVRFLGGLTPAQQTAFAKASARWSGVIIGDVPPVVLNGERIDDVLIEAQGIPIDGPGGVLGQAGPTHIRPSSNLPVKGIMSFDTADLLKMESDGSLEDVILHEMAHVLGFGTLWGPNYMDLIVSAGTINPTFVGAAAMTEYARLTNRQAPTPVPVANTGGKGTRDGHWREAVFGNELLTGFLSGSVRPLSLMSVAAFEDMGYQVNRNAADPYTLPSTLIVAELGLLGDRHDADTCALERVSPVIVPPSAMVNRL